MASQVVMVLDRQADRSNTINSRPDANFESKAVLPVLDEIRTLTRDSVLVQMWVDFQELAYLGGSDLDLHGLHKRLQKEATDLDQLLKSKVPAYRKTVEQAELEVRAERTVFVDDHITSIEGEDELFAGLV